MSIELMPHQKRNALYHIKYKKTGDFSEQGTGKTYTAIASLLGVDDIEAALIVCPHHLLYDWAEALEYFGIKDYYVFERRRINKEKDLFKILETYPIIITNYAQVRLKLDLFKLFVSKYKVYVIADEAHILGEMKSKITKSFIALGKIAERMLLMTGTPFSNKPVKVYSLSKVLQKNIWRTKNDFLMKYALMKQIRVRQGSGYRYINVVERWVHLEKLYEEIKTFAVRVEKKDIFDLPERIFVKRTLPMEKKQTKIYNQLLEEMLYVNEQGEPYLAVNSLSKFIRLRQVSSNPFIIEPNYCKGWTEREKALIEDLKNYEGKKVVFVEFVHTFNRLQELFREHKIKFVSVRGGEKNVHLKVNTFKEDEEVEVFLGLRAACYTGLNLQVASTLINFELNFDLIQYSQSIDRIHRYGQKNKVIVINYVQTEMEKLILKALQTKMDNERQVLDLFKKELPKDIKMPRKKA